MDRSTSCSPRRRALHGPGVRVGRPVFACLLVALACGSAVALDLSPLWDYGNPELSEQRFRRALEQAAGDDALILRTQIARTYGMRRNFDTAREMLRRLEPEIAAAGPEARARHRLEWGRTFASSAHRPEQVTPEAKATARDAYDAAWKIARDAGIDDLAVDAIHMFALVDTAPADQLKWAQAALDVVLSSSQPSARRWEPSIRHNLGYALHQLGRHDEALAQFRAAAALRERGNDAAETRVAHWMIAWTLRSLGRIDEALAIQLRLEEETRAAGAPDPYVFEELEALYRAKGDADRAARYADLRKAARGR